MLFGGMHVNIDKLFFGKKIGRLSCLPRRASASSRSHSGPGGLELEGCRILTCLQGGHGPGQALEKQERMWERWGPKLGPMPGGGQWRHCRAVGLGAVSHSSTVQLCSPSPGRCIRVPFSCQWSPASYRATRWMAAVLFGPSTKGGQLTAAVIL